MDVASIVLIVLLLILAIDGFRRGLIDVLLGIIKGFISLFVSFFLARPVGAVIFKLGLGNLLTNNMGNAFLNKNAEIFGTVVTADNKAELITKALTELKIPSAFHNTIANFLSQYIHDTGGEQLCYYFGRTAATFICIIIAFLVLVLGLFIILHYLRKALKNINKIPVVGTLNRALGLVAQLVYGLLIVCFVFWITALISASIPAVNDFVIKILAIDSPKFGLAKWIYQHNIAILLFEWLTTKLGI